jgi:hypothetical protein
MKDRWCCRVWICRFMDSILHVMCVYIYIYVHDLPLLHFTSVTPICYWAPLSQKWKMIFTCPKYYWHCTNIWPEQILYIFLRYIIIRWLRWSRSSVLAFSTQVRGFKPGRSRRILNTYVGTALCHVNSFCLVCFLWVIPWHLSFIFWRLGALCPIPSL